MPLIRKVSKNNVGSYVITLPKDWVDNVVRAKGKDFTEVLIDVNDELIVKPFFGEEK